MVTGDEGRPVDTKVFNLVARYIRSLSVISKKPQFFGGGVVWCVCFDAVVCW